MGRTFSFIAVIIAYVCCFTCYSSWMSLILRSNRNQFSCHLPVSKLHLVSNNFSFIQLILGGNETPHINKEQMEGENRDKQRGLHAKSACIFTHFLWAHKQFLFTILIRMILRLRLIGLSPGKINKSDKCLRYLSFCYFHLCYRRLPNVDRHGLLVAYSSPFFIRNNFPLLPTPTSSTHRFQFITLRLRPYHSTRHRSIIRL